MGSHQNPVMYLTTKLHEAGTVSSPNNVTNWVGTVWMTPILGEYIANAHPGRYWTFVISSAIYLVATNVLHDDLNSFGKPMPFYEKIFRI